MLIAGLKTHFPARMSEWFNSAILITWGSYLIFNPGLFSNSNVGSVFTEMGVMAWGNSSPEAAWGLCALFVGLIRVSALFINGAWYRTPLLRLITAGFSAFIWTQVVIGLYSVPNTGLAVYPWLVAIDLVAAYRAGKDAAVAELARRNELRKQDRGRSSTSRNPAA